MPLIDTVKNLVKDVSGKLIDPTDYDNAILAALARYSKFRSRPVVVDVTGNGGHDYDLPDSWCDGLSTILGIEYPPGNIPETVLDSADYKLYATPDGTKLRLLTVTLEATETFRLVITVSHTAEATVPPSDLDAIASLAAANCCRQLAAAHAQTSDPTIGADSVNYRSKSGEFLRLAKDYEVRFNSHLGIKDDETTPAAMVTAYPADSTRPRLTHLRRVR